MTTSAIALQEYSDDKRLSVYKMLISACTHLYSKGKLQEDKFMAVANIFADLAINDPIFMAHLTAWAFKNDSTHKDLRVLAVFFNSLNDANGTPFFKGAKSNKPNFREVSQVLLQSMDPHLSLRVLQLCRKKFGVKGILNESAHFSTCMKTAFRKYVQYREANEAMLRGIKKSGMSSKMQNIYRLCRIAPSDEAASILNWKQGSIKKGTRKDISMEKLPDFSKMTSAEIVESLKETKISTVVALSVIPINKITASVAKALLLNCTGNQAIILYNWFNKNGFLDVKAIKALFAEKIQQSTTAVDRIDTLAKNADEQDKKEMASARSARRKAQANTGALGKIFMHIDSSTSMAQAIAFAKEKAAIIAECVENPSENFKWGLFDKSGRVLPAPVGFTKEDFHQALYGVVANGGATDCVALYSKAREFGADIDVYVTDQGHNVGDIVRKINTFHGDNPSAQKPKAALIIDFGRGTTILENALRSAGIPVAIMKPEALTESALVAQSVRNALVGELAIIEEILDVDLPKLPKWWNSIGKKANSINA